jgi:GTPase SAR1 family protein
MTTRTFSEQLISEWLQLNDYFVETGVPLQSPTSKSRAEADIIAVKDNKGKLEVLHVEVGGLSSSAEKDLKKVEKKTTPEMQLAIKNYVKNKLGREPEYSFRYISLWSKKRSHELISEKIQIDLLSDVIQKDILEDIKKWRLKNKKTEKSQLPSPPNNLWMIQLLNHMCLYGINLKPYWGKHAKQEREVL